MYRPSGDQRSLEDIFPVGDVKAWINWVSISCEENLP